MKEVTTCVTRSSEEVAMSQDEGTFTMIIKFLTKAQFKTKANFHLAQGINGAKFATLAGERKTYKIFLSRPKSHSRSFGFLYLCYIKGIIVIN